MGNQTITKEKDLNKAFWAYLNGVFEDSDTLLTPEGKVLYKLAIDGGVTNSITEIAKFLGMPNERVGPILRKPGLSKYIIIISEQNRKVVMLNEQAKDRGMKLAYGTIRPKQEKGKR